MMILAIELDRREVEGVGVAQAVADPVSRKDLASFLGTTPESVSRRLADFEEAGWIRQRSPRRIEIMDLDALLLL